MHERPIQDLLDALTQLGVDAASETGNGCPPVVVQARGLKAGTTRIRGDVSSQFLSAVLLIAPAVAVASGQAFKIEIEGPLVSVPYVAMTLAVMRSFGAVVINDAQWRTFTVEPVAYEGREYAIEPDASAASYFWAAAAITADRYKYSDSVATACKATWLFATAWPKWAAA